MTQAAFVHPEKSTIDRFNQPMAHAFSWSHSLVPQLAERWAFRRFMTPARQKPPSVEAALLAAARSLRVELEPSGDRLAAWQWGEGPPVLLVHGWEGRAAQFSEWIPRLIERGFSAVAFDAPAHGRSPGGQASLRTFALAARSVAARVGPLQGLVGHSLGGLAALLALRQDLRAESAVVIAPPSPGSHFSGFCRQLGLDSGARSRIAQRIETEVGLPFDAVEGSALAADLRTPGLVIHDRSDKEAPFYVGAATAAAWPDAILHATVALGHRRILRDPEVVETALGFISRHRLGLAQSSDLERWLDFHEGRLMASFSMADHG
jgi:pimeloyl-ACP methyl ester carboxylesterase